MENLIKISGMTCNGCVSSVENTMKKTAGVVGIKVNLKDGNAVVSFDESKITANQICEKINDAGFEASI